MATNNFDWSRCVNSFTPQQGRDLATERGVDNLTIDQFHSRSWIGSEYVPKWKARCIAFPVCDSNGDVTRCHCRSPKRNGDGKFGWAYQPAGKGQNHSASALVFGNPNSAKTVYIFESQWDAIVLVDRLKLISEIDAGEVVVIATRGAKFGDRLAGFNWSAGAEIYACPQNDVPGKEWLDEVVQALNGCYAFEVPTSHKDLNEWTLAGATASEIEWVIDHATLLAPQTLDPEEKLFQELLTKYQSAVCTSKEFEALSITPRAPLAGNWLMEGDLGFVWGERGGGKTWFVDALAVHLSIGQDLSGWEIPHAVDVLYVDGEMPADAARARLKGLAAGNSRLHVLHHEILFLKTGLVMNLTEPRGQRVLSELCITKNVKLVILDNLSCSFSGLPENDSDAWEKVLSWLLDLRRRRIAVLIVHHSSKAGTMRGTYRREDAAFWVIRVDRVLTHDPHDTGARFETSFEKQRNSPIQEWARKWTFQTDSNGEVSIHWEEISFDTKVLDRIEAGLTSASDIASELGVHKSTVSRAARRLKDAKLITIDGCGRYHSIRYGKP